MRVSYNSQESVAVSALLSCFLDSKVLSYPPTTCSNNILGKRRPMLISASKVCQCDQQDCSENVNVTLCDFSLETNLKANKGQIDTDISNVFFYFFCSTASQCVIC